MYKYKSFSEILRSSAAEDSSLKERKTQGGWFLLNSRPSKTPVLTWVSDAQTGFYSGLSF